MLNTFHQGIEVSERLLFPITNESVCVISVLEMENLGDNQWTRHDSIVCVHASVSVFCCCLFSAVV